MALLFLLLPALLASPNRIVSTTPSITEILFALGLGDRVVGVSSFCRYPAEATRKARIGSFLDPHVETILGMRPDLVLVQKNPVRLTERLRAVKLNVLEVNPESMQGVHETIAAIAAQAGVPQRGEELSRRIRADLAAVRAKSAALRKRRVLFVVGRTPGTLDGLIAAARGSYLSELFEIAGATNLFADAPAAYPKVTHEEILARDPEVILDMGDSSHTGAAPTAAEREAVKRLWSRYPKISAVGSGRVYPLSDDRFVVPGPRMAEAVRMFGRMIHPEVGW